jgi:hypothetical protein
MRVTWLRFDLCSHVPSPLMIPVPFSIVTANQVLECKGQTVSAPFMALNTGTPNREFRSQATQEMSCSMKEPYQDVAEMCAVAVVGAVVDHGGQF